MRRVWTGIVTLACTGALVAAALPAGAATGAGRRGVGISGSTWDPKIAPIAAEVENLRGLKFEHSVPVHYLDEAKFQKQLLGNDKPPTAAQTAEFKRSEQQLRALGVLDHDIDLRAMARKTVGSSTLAFYNDKTKQVYVRGTDTTAPATRVTLAHELTHALQDQHFDLLKIQREAAAHDNADVMKGVIEGDATFVQNAFADELTDDQRKEYDATTASQTAEAQALDVPEILKVELAAPYALGESLVGTVHDVKGRSGENGLFTDPPTSDLALVDPTAALDHTKKIAVPTPKLVAGEKQMGKAEQLGSFSLFSVLATRIPALDALRAADAWRGDRMVTFDRSGQTCVRVDVQGADAAGTAKIEAAMNQWTAASGASGAVASTVAQRRAELTSCAPTGTVAAIPPNTLLDATKLVAERNAFMGGLVQPLGSPSRAACVATELIGNAGVQNVLDQIDLGTIPAATGQDELSQVIAANRSSILSACP